MYHQSLDALHDTWEQCRACELGVRRDSNNGMYVAGEGEPGGVLFVGEGPGSEEERVGRPFVGPSGAILRQVLEKLNFQNYYVTNTVACRSCVPLLDAQGLPRLRKNLPIYKDDKPTTTQVDACLTRLHNEIYLVDPIVVVALGGTAAEALLRRSVSITRDRGQLEHINVPGTTHKAVYTDKKGVWVRKSGGKVTLPTVRNNVRYLLVPTFHPAFVARQLADRGPRGAFQLFASDIKLAIKVYEKYQLELNGGTPVAEPVIDEPIQYEPPAWDEDDFDIND